MNSKPRPQNEILVPLGVFSKISDEHPRHFHTGVPPPPPGKFVQLSVDVALLTNSRHEWVQISKNVCWYLFKFSTSYGVVRKVIVL